MRFRLFGEWGRLYPEMSLFPFSSSQAVLRFWDLADVRIVLWPRGYLTSLYWPQLENRLMSPFAWWCCVKRTARSTEGVLCAVLVPADLR